jgi:flagellar biosynthetic protein FliR
MEELFSRLLNDPQLAALARVAGLLLARVLPIVVMTPIFGGQVLPRRLRVGITMLLVIVLLPAMSASSAALAPLSGIEYGALVAKEAVLGLVIAKMIELMYYGFVAFGALVDLSRGATIANVFDPVTQQQESVLGSFFLQVAIVLFLTLGGHHVIIETLGDSLAALPPHAFVPDRLSGASGLTHVLVVFGELLVFAIRLAMPVIAVVLLLDVVLGLLNRVAPQVQVYFIGLTVKSGLGLLIVFLSLTVTWQLFGDHFVHSIRALQQWIAGGG